MLNLPNIQNYSDIRDFLKDIIAANQTNTSHRKFADEVGWPASLLGDVVQGRRGLAVARAVELGRHFNMSGIDTERLVMLSLKSSEHQGVREFVDEYLDMPGKPWVNPSETEQLSKTGVFVFSPEDMTDQSLASLFIFLVWCNGKTTSKEISDHLYLSPELKNQDVLDERLQKLRGLGLIAGHLPEIQILQPNTGSSGMKKDQYFRSLDALKRVIPVSDARTHWFLSRLVFPVERYEELNQRVQSLLNWIQNTCVSRKHDDKRDYVILQVNFMLTHLLDLSKASLALKKSSDGRHRIEKL